MTTGNDQKGASGSIPPASNNTPVTVSKADFDALQAKYAELEASAKTYVKPEDHQKVVEELNKLKTDSQKAAEAAKMAQAAQIEARKTALIAKGISKDRVDKFTEAELGMAEGLLEAVKPRPDLGGSGGITGLTGSPYELARQAYASSNKK